MTLIVDVDINLLKELHEHGSVNTMKDRRHDLYSLKKLNNEKLFRMCRKIVVRTKNSVVTVVVTPITTK
jgi:hypothetical protein